MDRELKRGGPQRIPRPPTVKPGRPAPWADIADVEPLLDLDRVRDVFSAAGPPVRTPRRSQVARGSAVVAPMYEEDGETSLILTRRSAALRSHSGEVSFPGGRQDPGETLEETARREAQEEIGLDPASLELVGELDHLSTISSQSFIVPYVGVVTGRPKLVTNPAEVAAILDVSLRELLNPSVYREEKWDLYGAERSIFFFELYGDTVWGATAAMLRQLLGLLTGTVDRGGIDHL